MKRLALIALLLAAACSKKDHDNAKADQPAAAEGSGEKQHHMDPAQRRQRLEQMRTKLDTNGDGKLSPEELGAAQGRMRFDDPASLDTNHDGDISVDELEAAMNARRAKWRAGSGSAAGGAPAAEGSGE